MQDLFSWLIEEFNKKKQNEHLDLSADAQAVAVKLAILEKSAISTFVCFCQEKLKANPPVGTYPAQQGIGLRLTDGTLVSVQPQTGKPGADSQTMPITTAPRMPGQDGISDTRSIPVFGREED